MSVALILVLLGIGVGEPWPRILFGVFYWGCVVAVWLASGSVPIRTGVSIGFLLALAWTLVGLGLDLSLTRILAGVGSVLMLLSLFALLGPLGARLCNTENRMWRLLARSLRPFANRGPNVRASRTGRHRGT